MQIQISEGVGNGPTELAAFDQALVNAGVANYNLIYLSSVLPPGSEVVYNDGNNRRVIGETAYMWSWPRSGYHNGTTRRGQALAGYRI